MTVKEYIINNIENYNEFNIMSTKLEDAEARFNIKIPASLKTTEKKINFLDKIGELFGIENLYNAEFYFSYHFWKPDPQYNIDDIPIHLSHILANASTGRYIVNVYKV